MRIHVIKHVPFEGPGLIARWSESHGHSLTEELASAGRFPDVADVGMVVVMGGPMGVYDEDEYPWLAAEKRWLRAVVDARVPMLGVCLGAQLLAETIGGRVVRGPEPEIGWFEVAMTDAGLHEPLLGAWPARLVVGHWHGDTFELPEGVPSLAASAAYANQAFAFESRVVGLQFHIEWTLDALDSLLEACADELEPPRTYVQTAASMRAEAAGRIGRCEGPLFALLDGLASRADGEPGVTAG